MANVTQTAVRSVSSLIVAVCPHDRPSRVGSTDVMHNFLSIHTASHCQYCWISAEQLGIADTSGSYEYTADQTVYSEVTG